MNSTDFLVGPLCRETMFSDPHVVAAAMHTWFGTNEAHTLNTIQWLRIIADDLEKAEH